MACLPCPCSQDTHRPHPLAGEKEPWRSIWRDPYANGPRPCCLAGSGHTDFKTIKKGAMEGALLAESTKEKKKGGKGSVISRCLSCLRLIESRTGQMAGVQREVEYGRIIQLQINSSQLS